jgi:site-specific recombinase XerD
LSAPPAAKRRRKPKSTIKYLTAEEIERLFGAIKEPRDRALFRLAYHRGLRASEVGLLLMTHYRAAAERLYVTRLKNGNSGEYGLTSIEVKALRAWLKERGSKAGAIFLSKKNRPISQQMLDVLMKGYCRAAHIPPDKSHFHALRHSCATSLLERGRDIAEVKDHLGHVSIANTDIYAKITNSRRDRAADELRDWK